MHASIFLTALSKYGPPCSLIWLFIIAIMNSVSFIAKDFFFKSQPQPTFLPLISYCSSLIVFILRNGQLGWMWKIGDINEKLKLFFSPVSSTHENLNLPLSFRMCFLFFFFPSQVMSMWNKQPREIELHRVTFEGQIRCPARKEEYSLAALMKLLWYWYVMRGAGRTLKRKKKK